MKVTDPRTMNETFARAFNSRNISNLIALYEPGAMLRIDASDRALIGTDQTAAELSALLHVTGTMISNNIFCIEQGDLALLRADWKLVADDGGVVVSGSSAEIVRRQADGSWLYVIDHATGASLTGVT
jgi:ketosteroid isomerase-like protein